MLKWAFIFGAIAFVAGFFGFSHPAGILATIASGIFFIFIAMAIFLFASHFLQPRRQVG